MFLAVTLKVQHRSEFTYELSLLRGAIEYLEQFGHISPYLFELQPEGLHLMHVHLCLQTEYINYKELHQIMKNYDINCDIHSIPEEELRYWLPYCVKNRGDLAMQYAESTGNEYARTRLFHRIVTAQQMGAVEQTCHMCCNLKSAICGIYKCWI